MPRNPSPCTRLITGGKVVGLTKYVMCDALNELINQINYIYSVNEVIKLNQLKIKRQVRVLARALESTVSVMSSLSYRNRKFKTHIYIISYEGQSDQII